MNEPMSPRQALLEEMEKTLEAYRSLLKVIPPEALDMPTANPAWNVREVLYHMSLAPRFMLTDVRIITAYTRQHRWLYRAMELLVPKSLFDWLNQSYTRLGARNASLHSLAREYERAHQLAIRALAEVADDQFGTSLQYPDWDPILSGAVTVERLFHYVKDHYEAHAAELREIAADHPSIDGKAPVDALCTMFEGGGTGRASAALRHGRSP